MPLLRRDEVHHRLGRGHLIFAAEGHEDGPRADGGIEAFGKPALGADVEIARKRLHPFRKVLRYRAFVVFAALRRYRDMFFRAVGIQELARDVDDGLAVPRHHEAGLFRHFGNDGRLQIFFARKFDEALRFVRFDDDRHALLRFGDGKFGAVEAVVLLGYGVEVDRKAVGKLADGDGHAARTEVVAALDEQHRLLVAEEALELSLFGRVALLHFRAAVGERFERVRLTRARRAAAAVAARSAAEEDDKIARRRHFAPHVLRGRCRDDRADLEALCDIPAVIEFIDLPRRKADLVAVGRIARRSRRDDLALGELALHRIADGNERIARARHAHGGIDVAPARERIADGAADAGRRAAEGLDLRGVIVRLVLEKEQPVLRLAVDIHLDLDGAGVDLLRFVELFEHPALFQHFCGERADVHQVDRLGAVKFPARRKILLVGRLQQGIVEGDAVHRRQKGGVAAVIRPIGVDHADLREGGIAPLFAEIVAAEGDVVLVHREGILIDKLLKLLPFHLQKAAERFHFGGNGVRDVQRFGESEARLAALHGVDDVLFEGGKRLFGDVPVHRIELCRAHEGALALRNELDALRRRIGALIELPGEVFHSEHLGARKFEFFRRSVHLRLGKHRLHAGVEERFFNVFGVVTVDDADVLDARKLQKLSCVRKEALRLVVEPVLLFHVDPVNHVSSPISF